MHSIDASAISGPVKVRVKGDFERAPNTSTHKALKRQLEPRGPPARRGHGIEMPADPPFGILLCRVGGGACDPVGGKA